MQIRQSRAHWPSDSRYLPTVQNSGSARGYQRPSAPSAMRTGTQQPRGQIVCLCVSSDEREHPLLADMEVIVRLQGQEAQRLDHLHDQALCGPQGAGDLRSPT